MHDHLSQHPGRHERHFRRRLNTPLFARPTETDLSTLLAAQRRDRDELQAFLGELREAVQSAVDLQPNEETQVVLDLKERLEKLYETASCLAEDQTANKAALARLIEVIMDKVRVGAAGDALAEEELQQEEIARATHFQLLEQPLVAELLNPKSLIDPDELVATLLSENQDALKAALQLFDQDQLLMLVAEAQQLLVAKDPDKTGQPDAWQGLALMEQRLRAWTGRSAPYSS